MTDHHCLALASTLVLTHTNTATDLSFFINLVISFWASHRPRQSTSSPLHASRRYHSPANSFDHSWIGELCPIKKFIRSISLRFPPISIQLFYIYTYTCPPSFRQDVLHHLEGACPAFYPPHVIHLSFHLFEVLVLSLNYHLLFSRSFLFGLLCLPFTGCPVLMPSKWLVFLFFFN
jgi:hypothetical protein